MFTKVKYNIISELTSYHNNNIYAYHYMHIYIIMYIRFIKNQMTFQFSYFFRVFFLKYRIVHSVIGPGVLKL